MGENTALRGTGAGAAHILLPMRQEVNDPPAGGFWYMQQGELLL